MPHPEESPKEDSQAVAPPSSGLCRLSGQFKCCCNLWRFFCRRPTRLELDVSDSEFSNVISEIRSKKAYYAPVLPQQKRERKVLVLDLDETLIHTSFTKPGKYDYESEVEVGLCR